MLSRGWCSSSQSCHWEMSIHSSPKPQWILIIIIAIDTSENFGDEAEMLNNVLNVFTAAFVATDGNLEVVVMNRHTICISAPPDSGGCSSDENLARYRHMRTDVESNEARVTIRSAYDEWLNLCTSKKS